jgi:hypothetical protein
MDEEKKVAEEPTETLERLTVDLAAPALHKFMNNKYEIKFLKGIIASPDQYLLYPSNEKEDEETANQKHFHGLFALYKKVSGNSIVDDVIEFFPTEDILRNIIDQKMRHNLTFSDVINRYVQDEMKFEGVTEEDAYVKLYCYQMEQLGFEQIHPDKYKGAPKNAIIFRISRHAFAAFEKYMNGDNAFSKTWIMGSSDCDIHLVKLDKPGGSLCDLYQLIVKMIRCNELDENKIHPESKED